MTSINKIILVGNVGKDPEIKGTPSTNVKYATCSLATSESWRDKTTGQKKENVTWHNLKAFEPLASIFEKYVKKGSKIYIEGTLRIHEYEKDGAKVKHIEVLVRQLVLLDSKEKKEPYNDYSIRAEQNILVPAPTDMYDDEIPF